MCKKWPIDETKAGRDYGEFFRQQIKKEFPYDKQSQVKDPVKLDAAISSLERLADNSYFNENPLKRSSATGVEAWACRLAVSTEGLRAIQEQEEASLIKKLRKSLNVKFIKKDAAETAKKIDSEIDTKQSAAPKSNNSLKQREDTTGTNKVD